jgi:hypothetical protein
MRQSSPRSRSTLLRFPAPATVTPSNPDADGAAYRAIVRVLDQHPEGARLGLAAVLTEHRVGQEVLKLIASAWIKAGALGGQIP